MPLYHNFDCYDIQFKKLNFLISYSYNNTIYYDGNFTTFFLKNKPYVLIILWQNGLHFTVDTFQNGVFFNATPCQT